MTKNLLPEGFTELETWVAIWALPTETERNRKHLASSMREVKAFYDAILPRLEDILDHLRALEAGGRPKSIPEESKNLFYLSLSLAEVSLSVEVHGQIGVVDGFPASRWLPEHELADWRALEQRLRPTLA
ncbi:MAG: Xaa-Pro dipeptidase [Gammaproteobacteria bacterium]|nr:Xaa-Pro dipeptidase [Gammaproteobacteria bacterium]